MSELIEVRRLKPTLSYPHPYMFTTNEILSDYYNGETFQTFPVIINTQQIKYREPILSQYVPSRSFTTVIENQPLVYQRIHTPTLIEEQPLAVYRSCETPVQRLVRVQPSRKNVHLPKHTKKLVNRFLNNLEQAHDHQVSVIKKIVLRNLEI
jgi:hypothetical protein